MARTERPIPDRMRKFAIYTTASRINPSYVPPGMDAKNMLETQLLPMLKRINDEGTLVVRIAPDLPGAYYSFQLTEEEFEAAANLARSWCEQGLSMEQMDAEEERVRVEAATLKPGTSIHALEGRSEADAKLLVRSLRRAGWFPGEPYLYGDGYTWCVEVADTPAYYGENGWSEVEALDKIAHLFGFSWSAHETTFHVGENGKETDS